MILVVFAHPYAARSHANRSLLQAIEGLAALEVRALYDLYPDYSIDVAAEQRALAAARLVVWQHPLHWYGVPSLLKLWFEQVLSYGWAYGDGGTALHGKDCLWVATTGGSAASYGPEGEHERPFSAFVAPVQQTARYCGMNWLAPLIVHCPATGEGSGLARAAEDYRVRLAAYAGAPGAEVPHG